MIFSFIFLYFLDILHYYLFNFNCGIFSYTEVLVYV